MIAGPKHWQTRRVISQEKQEAKADKPEDMPDQKRKEIKKEQQNTPLKCNERKLSWEQIKS